MKIALVHDYLNEYGGAERVLSALADIWPEAPIYTAFYRHGSAAYEQFKERDIRVSWAHYIPGFAEKLHSPLRFLAPHIWQSFDFSGFDAVISSSSWYITKGINVPQCTLHVSYIHTPPRFLYGYSTSIQYQRYPLIKLYAALVNKGLRQFDYESAQTVDVLVANSKEVQNRIKKFWRRDSTVIYPPVESNNFQFSINKNRKNYYLTGGRLVGPKHFDLAIRAANELKLTLKIFGTGPEEAKLKVLAGPTVELVGKVDDVALSELYAGAAAFVALADDEDFGITPVEAMMAGTPVVAYWGGGYQESVIEGETGVFVNELTTAAVKQGMERITDFQFSISKIQNHAQKFSKERFMKEVKQLVETEWEKKRAA